MEIFIRQGAGCRLFIRLPLALVLFAVSLFAQERSAFSAFPALPEFPWTSFPRTAKSAGESAAKSARDFEFHR